MNENIQQSPGQTSATSGQHAAQSRNNKAGIGCAVVFFGFFALMMVLSATGVFDSDSDDGSTFQGDESDYYSEYGTYSGQPIPRFSDEDSRKLSQELAQAEKRYGVCFGWKLTDGSRDSESSSEPDPPGSFDQGSSRGPNTPASTCQRWVEVQVVVAYTSESSEQWSGVDLEVKSSQDLSRVPYSSDFAELGIDAETFIDAPVATTGHAAKALPLLMTQTGALEYKPPAPETAPPSQPLPPAEGSSGNLWTWIWLGALGAVTVVGLVLGFRGVSRQKAQAADSGPPQGPPPPGPPPGGPPQGGPPQQGPPPNWPQQHPPGGPFPPGQQPPPAGPQWGTPPQGPQHPPRPPQGPHPGAPPGPPPNPPRH